jgi:hypothetical protein
MEKIQESAVEVIAYLKRSVRLVFKDPPTYFAVA